MKSLWKDSLSLRENLRRRMPKLAQQYFDDGDKALVAGTDWDQMHKFRLRTKRFRYTLETFRDLYGPGIEKRIDSLRKVQTYLGDINDCIVTAELLKDRQDSEEVRSKLQKKAEDLRSKLSGYWTRTFAAGRPRVVWTSYLATYACRPSGSQPSQRGGSVKKMQAPL